MDISLVDSCQSFSRQGKLAQPTGLASPSLLFRIRISDLQSENQLLNSLLILPGSFYHLQIQILWLIWICRSLSPHLSPQPCAQFPRKNKIPGPFAPPSLKNRTTKDWLQIPLAFGGFLVGNLRPFEFLPEGIECVVRNICWLYPHPMIISNSGL